jgi:hypothetical protein
VNNLGKDPFLFTNAAMSQDIRPLPLYTQVDITANPSGASTDAPAGALEQAHVLREILVALDRQNELLEELVTNTSQHQRQRENELKKWRQENPHLAKNCRTAVNSLSQIHAGLLESMTNDINADADDMLEGDYALNEFVDRYGPRLAHLTGMLHILSQLGFPNNAPAAE